MKTKKIREETERGNIPRTQSLKNQKSRTGRGVPRLDCPNSWGRDKKPREGDLLGGRPP